MQDPGATRFLRATPAEREHFEIGRFGVYWPEIDEDIELAALLLGAKAPGAAPPEDELLMRFYRPQIGRDQKRFLEKGS
jgi:hypothetical protein